MHLSRVGAKQLWRPTVTNWFFGRKRSRSMHGEQMSQSDSFAQQGGATKQSQVGSSAQGVKPRQLWRARGAAFRSSRGLSAVGVLVVVLERSSSRRQHPRMRRSALSPLPLPLPRPAVTPTSLPSLRSAIATRRTSLRRIAPARMPRKPSSMPRRASSLTPTPPPSALRPNLRPRAARSTPRSVSLASALVLQLLKRKGTAASDRPQPETALLSTTSSRIPVRGGWPDSMYPFWNSASS